MLIMGAAKLLAMHSAHAAAGHVVAGHVAAVAGSGVGGAAAGAGGAAVAHHVIAALFIGVAAGTVMYSICKCLEKLLKKGVFSEQQAKSYKYKAEHSDEKTQKEMLRDAEDLCAKYNC